MIELGELIGKGSERACYMDPSDKDKCIKVSKLDAAKQSKREIRYLGSLPDQVYRIGHIPRYYGVIEDSESLALSQEIIRDSDGGLSKGLDYYLSTDYPLNELVPVMLKLYEFLVEYNIIPCDLNAENVLIQKTDQGLRAVLIDGFGATELIPVAQWCHFLGKKKIFRKWNRSFPNAFNVR